MLNKKFNGSIREHFSIRKLTIGVASVLISVSFFGFSGSKVQAAENSVNNQPETEQVVKNETLQNNVADQSTNRDSQSNQELQQALIPGKNNTNQPNKVNGQGNNAAITNVPTNGSIEYNYSISAKDKNNGQIQTVNTGAAKHDNTAILVTKNAEDIQAHLELKNISKKDQFIGNSEWGTNNNPNKFNDDEADLFINAWSGGQGSLKIDSKKAANVVFTKNGEVINDNALPVYYLAKNGTWYTYQDMLKNFGATSIPQVTQIGFKGIIPGETTATMNVPLVVDPTASADNQIDTKSLNDQSIYVTTYNEPEKIWSIDEIKNEPLHLTTRNQDGTYILIDDSTFANLLPKAGQVVKIINSGNLLDTSNQTLYKNGIYVIELPAIQAVLQKYGYSVDPMSKNLTKLMSVYTYNANDNHLIIYAQDGKSVIKSAKPYLYIEVHKIINSKNETFEEGSPAIQNWNYRDGITDVYNVTNPTADHTTGYIYQNVPGNLQNVKLVNIKDSTGKIVKNIDGQTPAGTYYVTVAYKLNNSDDPAMLIEKTFEVTVTPKPAPVIPDNPIPNTPQVPTPTPSQPTNNSPVPITPTVRPLPEDTDNNTKPGKVKKNDNEVIAPKAQKANERTNKQIISGKKVNVKPTAINKSVSSHSIKTSTAYKVNAAVKAQNVTKEDNKSSASLPQTGASLDDLALLGLSLIGIASLIGLDILHKKEF